MRMTPFRALEFWWAAYLAALSSGRLVQDAADIADQSVALYQVRWNAALEESNRKGGGGGRG